MRLRICAFLLVLWPALGLAQTATPNSLIEFEIDPGRMQSGTSTVPRPITNVAFEQRVDGGAVAPAVLDASCVAATAPFFTCRVRLPALSEGPHTFEIRGTPQPPETGVVAGPFGSISVTILVVTPPGQPTKMRVVTSQP